MGKKLLRALVIVLLTTLVIEPSVSKIVHASDDTSLPPVHYSVNKQIQK